MSGAYRLVRNDAADGLRGHLFVDPAFIAYQCGAQGKRPVTFSVADRDRGVVASLTLASGGGVWTSPITGAFGGVAAAAEDGSRGAVFALAEAATAWLRGEARSGAVLRLPPDSFSDPNARPLEEALQQLGWRLEQTDINQHLPITSPEAFFQGLGETRQKEIRRLRRSGASFRALPPAEGLRAYRAIADNRAARGYPMTMTWSALEDLARALPDKISFWAAERDQQVLAGAICLLLAPAYAYVFYWGEPPAFRKESPVLLLAEGLVAEQHRRGVAVLDLGTSTVNSAPNPGLIAFKESLGCVATDKRTYVLDAP